MLYILIGLAGLSVLSYLNFKETRGGTLEERVSALLTVISAVLFIALSLTYGVIQVF